MFKFVFKWVVRAVSLCVVAVLLAVLVLQFYPRAYFGLVNQFSPYHIDAKTVELNVLSFSIELMGLTVEEKSSEIEQLNLERLFAKVSWQKLFLQRNNSWYLELDNGRASLPQANEPNTNTNQELASSVGVHDLLSSLNIKANNLQLLINDDTALDISRFNTNLNSDNHRYSADVKQHIELELRYKQAREVLSIKGKLDSVNSQGVNQLSLSFDELDLRSLLSKNQQADSLKKEAESNNPSVVQKSIDWSWLKTIEKTAVNISANTLIFDKGTISNLAFKSVVDDGLLIEKMSSDIKWALSESVFFDDRVEMAGRLNGLKNGDIETQLKLEFSAAVLEGDKLIVDGAKSKMIPKAGEKGFISVDGTLDPLEPLNSDLTFAAHISHIPLVDQTAQPINLQQYEQFLPASIGAHYQLNDKAYQLSNIQIKAGESDLKGDIQIAVNDDDILIDAELKSDYVAYKSVASPSPKKTQTTEPLFSKQAIDWSWLEEHQVNASFKAKALDVDGYSFEDVDVPITLQAGNLVINSLSASLGDSNVIGNIDISKQEKQIALETEIQANDINLSTLNLLDPKHLSGGLVTTNINLQSEGNSIHSIVSALNGRALITAKDATIGNDAFELIGSDLISELLSKLNPFAKSNPTTQLKCAVFNMPIKDGVVSIDNSIAVQTSKVTIVANGDINFSDETLKLDIKPTSTGGLGVNAGSLVKLITLGGKLNSPKPIVSTAGLLKTGVAVGAALSTGGATAIADGMLSKKMTQNACKDALKK